MQVIWGKKKSFTHTPLNNGKGFFIDLLLFLITLAENYPSIP